MQSIAKIGWFHEELPILIYYSLADSQEGPHSLFVLSFPISLTGPLLFLDGSHRSCMRGVTYHEHL